MIEKPKPNPHKISRIKGLRIYLKLLLLLLVMFICWRQWRIWSVPDVGIPFDKEAYLTEYSEEYRNEAVTLYINASEGFVDQKAIEQLVPLKPGEDESHPWARIHAINSWNYTNRQSEAWLDMNHEIITAWRELVNHTNKNVPIFEADMFAGSVWSSKPMYFDHAIKVPHDYTRQICLLMLYESARQMQQGDVEQALQWQMAVARLGTLIQHDTESSILSGHVITGLQVSASLDLLAHESITLDHLHELRDLYQELEQHKAAPSEFFITSYLQWDANYAQWTADWQYYYPSLLLGEIELERRNRNLLYQNIMSFCDLPYVERPQLAPDEEGWHYALFAPDEQQQEKYQISSAETVNKSIAKMIDPVGLYLEKGRIFDRLCIPVTNWFRTTQSHLMMRGLARLNVALQIYHREHGAFPDKLEQLVPGYVESIPLDHYLPGEPLKYRRHGAHSFVWSMGHDRNDFNGTEGKDTEYPNGKEDRCYMIFAPGTSFNEMIAFYTAQDEYWAPPPLPPRPESTRDR